MHFVELYYGFNPPATNSFRCAKTASSDASGCTKRYRIWASTTGPSCLPRTPTPPASSGFINTLPCDSKKKWERPGTTSDAFEQRSWQQQQQRQQQRQQPQQRQQQQRGRSMRTLMRGFISHARVNPHSTMSWCTRTTSASAAAWATPVCRIHACANTLHTHRQNDRMTK